MGFLKRRGQSKGGEVICADCGKHGSGDTWKQGWGWTNADGRPRYVCRECMDRITGARSSRREK